MGVLHDIGQIGGHALNALPGYSTLGSNITNPDVNYKGAYNPPTPENNYFQAPVAATSSNVSAPQVQGASTTNTADIAAKAAAVAKANATAGINATQTGDTSAARTSLTDVGNTYQDKTQSLIDTLLSGEHDINEGAIQNALNLRTSMQNIVKGVQTGIRSGGVTLAGMNASDSGAADALARAWAKVGNGQTGDANGQAAAQDQTLDYQQSQLNKQKDEGNASLDTYKGTETNRVAQDFGSKLDMLDASAQGQGVTGAVQHNLVDQVLNEALARLATIDQTRGSGEAGVVKLSADDVNSQAAARQAAGAAGTAFTVDQPTVAAGGQSVGTPVSGAPLGTLPIFVKKDTATATGD